MSTPRLVKLLLLKLTEMKNLKNLQGSSLTEMLIALGIAGATIFGMLLLAAKTSKLSRINQQRYIAAQVAAEGIELGMLSPVLIRDDPSGMYGTICENAMPVVKFGVLATPDGDDPLAINTTDLELNVGGTGYDLLPMEQGDDGSWTVCDGCAVGEAAMYRGLTIQRTENDEVPDAYYWKLESITYWNIFNQNEVHAINTRVEDICPE